MKLALLNILKATPLVALLAIAPGCGSEGAKTADDCGPADDAERGLATAGQGVEAGAETGAAGVKQFGKAVGGFFEDGADGAEREWEEGERDTEAEANEGADEVETAANDPHCNK